jgi:hypothetical protein
LPPFTKNFSKIIHVLTSRDVVSPKITYWRAPLLKGLLSDWKNGVTNWQDCYWRLSIVCEKLWPNYMILCTWFWYFFFLGSPVLGMLSQFPPQTVRLKVPFSIKPWTRLEDNAAKLLMAIICLYTFLIVLCHLSMDLDSWGPKLICQHTIYTMYLSGLIKQIVANWTAGVEILDYLCRCSRAFISYTWWVCPVSSWLCKFCFPFGLWTRVISSG